MGSPIDRTAKTALDSNLVNGNVSDAPKMKANNDVIYNYSDGLNSAQDAHAAAAILPHADSSVTGPKIRDLAVTTAKIADLAVTQAKIALGAVGPSQLQTGLAVTADVQAQFNKRGLDITSAPYYAVGDGLTNNTSGIQAAINQGGVIIVPPGKFKITAISNQLGIPFFSTGLIYADDGTNRAVENSYADVNQHIFGREYLSAFHKKLMARTAAKIVFSGDSTTAGDGTTTGYKINELMNFLTNKDGLGSLITTVNRGQSGVNTKQWVDTYLAGDLAALPDLLVLRWGINDPGWNQDGTAAPEGPAGDATRRTVDDYKTSLRAALTTIRASKTLSQMSIVLMTPNSTYASPTRRDSLWYEQIVPVIRQAARDFNCGFFDTYALWQDSVNGADYMDTPYADQQHVHPANVMNEWIAGTLYDVIVPYSIRNHVGGGITNYHSSFQIKSATEQPSLYPTGVSTLRAQTGFPYDGMVTTFYQSDDILLQFNSGYDTTKSEYAFRLGYRTTNVWSAWRYVGTSEPSKPFVYQNSWADYNATTHKPGGYYLDNSGKVNLEGLLAPGSLTPGITIAVLDVGYRPSKEVVLTCSANNGSARISVTSTGIMKLISIPAAATDLTLTGLTFPAR